MNKRSKLWAIVAAGVMTLGIAGIALAEDLNSGQVGNKLSSFDNICEGWPVDLPIGAGEIGVHFVLTSPDGDSGLLTASFSTDNFSNLADAGKVSTTMHWYAVITGDGNTTIDSASTDISGGNLNVSHVCAGATTTTTTSFSSSEESTTTSSSSSTTSFNSSQESTTTSQPQTDTIGATGTGNQATGMWLLVAALGVLLGSLVVVAPARAKNKR